MNFTVYYTDDQQHGDSIEANTHDMAAWKFVQAHPREKPAQLAVILTTPGRKRFGEVVVWWSSAFAGQPAPSVAVKPELKILVTGARVPEYEICGTPASLKLLATQLLHALEQGADQSSSGGCVYSVGLELNRRESYLSFHTDPDRKEESESIHWIIRIILLLLLCLLVIGIYTVIGWIL